MPTIKTHEEGMLCWADLSTPDLPAAKKFYTALFGWTTKDLSMGPDAGVYVMCEHNGQSVGALQEMSPSIADQGLPPHWLTYIAVKDVDKTSKKVHANGGKLLMDPMDVGDAGRMSIVIDPTGANVALWQGKRNPGAAVMNESSALCWMELMTTDAKKAGAFYQGLFGYNLKVSPDYTEFHVGEQAAGGMMEMKDKRFEGMPSHWSIYFMVPDCDAAAKKVTALGGKVLMPPMDIANVGRFAVVQDPQGATFNVLKFG